MLLSPAILRPSFWPPFSWVHFWVLRPPLWGSKGKGGGIGRVPVCASVREVLGECFLWWGAAGWVQFWVFRGRGGRVWVGWPAVARRGDVLPHEGKVGCSRLGLLRKTQWAGGAGLGFASVLVGACRWVR